MKNLFKDLLLEPIFVTHPERRLSCLFVIFVSIFIMLFWRFGYTAPVILPDTPSYFIVKIEDPWSSFRTPGTTIGAKIIGVDFGTDEIKPSGNTEHVIKETKKILYANYLIYVIVISTLIYTLCKILPPIYIILTVFGCYLVDIPNPYHILADPLAFIFSVVFLNFCIEFYRKKNLIFLFLLCLTAVFSFLVKPACCFCSIIAAIICLLELLGKQGKKLFLRIAIFLFLIIGTAIWPTWLYIKGGVFVVSQLSVITNTISMMHFMQDGDENLLQDDIDKKFIIRLLEEKKKYLKDNPERAVDSSAPILANTLPTIENYNKMRNLYGYSIAPEVMHEVYNKEFTLVERLHLNKRVCSPILKKYKHERIKFIFSSTKNGFTVNVSPAAYRINKIKPEFGKNLYIISFLLIFFGIVSGYMNGNKNETYLISSKLIVQIICICLFIHLIHLIVTSIGHYVMTRYVRITEWAFLLGVYLSIYNCLFCVIKVVGYTPSPSKSCEAVPLDAPASGHLETPRLRTRSAAEDQD